MSVETPWRWSEQVSGDEVDDFDVKKLESSDLGLFDRRWTKERV